MVLYVSLQICIDKLSTTWYNSILAFPIGVVCAAWREKIPRFNSRKMSLLILALFFISFFVMLICGTGRLEHLVNERILRVILQNISSALLALYSIRFASVVNIKSDTLKYIGVNSFSIFLAHQVLVMAYDKITDVYTYSFFVIAGTFALTWLYNNISFLIINKNGNKENL